LTIASSFHSAADVDLDDTDDDDGGLVEPMAGDAGVDFIPTL